LWMESDRMGHLLGVVDQEKLDEQRGVVQNEKRQGENQPTARRSQESVNLLSRKDILTHGQPLVQWMI